MQIIKEGLKTYLLEEQIKNSYFMEIEYEMIHQNNIQSFISMQMRSKDGECSLLYDITSVCSLKETVEKRALDYQACRNLLLSLKELLNSIELYMLQIEHVNLQKESLFWEKNYGLKSLYCPDQNFDAVKDISETLAWLLARVDYTDQKAVNLIYQAYDLLRNRGLSTSDIENLLSENRPVHQRKKEAAATKVNVEKSGDLRFQRLEDIESLGIANNKKASLSKTGAAPKIRKSDAGKAKLPAKKSRKKDARKAEISLEKSRKNDTGKGKSSSEKNRFFISKIVKIILGAGILAGIIWVAYCAMLCWKYGYSARILKYMIGGILIIAAFILGIFRGKGKENPPDEEKQEDSRQNNNDRESNEEKTQLLFSQKTDFQTDFIAGQERKRVIPTLRNLETGEVYSLTQIPNFIGSDHSMNDTVLPISTVSRQHAVIDKEKGSDFYNIRDLSSTNGTWLESRRIYDKAERLFPGSEIRFAENYFIFEL